MNVRGNGEFPEGQEAKMKIPERVCRVDNQTVRSFNSVSSLCDPEPVI